MTAGLLDTSVFVAREHERPLGALPDEGAVSVVTLAELQLGVLIADDAVRAARVQTLSLVEHTFDALPLDESIARRFAALVAEARRRGSRPRAMDAWIAATAAVHDLPLYTQDADFRAFGDDIAVVEF